VLRQVAERRGDAPADPAVRTSMRLANWRLKRVHDHVEENLAGRLSLADLAGSAGLSPMHFAAQFRGATGMRPHDYVLHRRIERAKPMLTGTLVPIGTIALRVGFRSAAHFATAFRRIAGVTPKAWRASRADDDETVDHALAA
jgi:AraC family transcriptional regulator